MPTCKTRKRPDCRHWWTKSRVCRSRSILLWHGYCCKWAVLGDSRLQDAPHPA